MMDSKDNKRVAKKVDIILLLYLFMWLVVLIFLDYFSKLLPIELKEFILRIDFWLLLIIYIIFSVSLYTYTYMRRPLLFRIHLILATLIVISSTFVFLSVFTRYAFLFVIFMLIFLIVTLIRKRKIMDQKR
jgi:hypothetical protein